MKTTGVGFLAAIGFILCTVGPVLAQPSDQQLTVLHLSQTAERNVLRDLLRIELRVEETGADPLAIQSGINSRMAAALDRAHKIQGVRVETGSYGVGEERPQSGPSRWRGTQSLILTGKDADAALKLAGALQWSSDVLARLRVFARNRARCRGGFDRRGVRRPGPARRLNR